MSFIQELSQVTKSFWVYDMLNFGNKYTFNNTISVQVCRCLFSSFQFLFDLNMFIIFINISDCSFLLTVETLIWFIKPVADLFQGI